jgi:hypothetical protein
LATGRIEILFPGWEDQIILRRSTNRILETNIL